MSAGSNDCSGATSGVHSKSMGPAFGSEDKRKGVVCFRRFLELSEVPGESEAVKSAMN